MSMLAKLRQSVGLKLLKAGSIPMPSAPLTWLDMLDRPELDDIATEVGNGTESDVLMTPIRWLQRAIIEAPLVAFDAEDSPLDSHKLVDLIRTPNPYYALSTLLAGTVFDLSLNGNAYWIIGRNRSGGIAEIWYGPSFAIEPVAPSAQRDAEGRAAPFVAYYKYSPGGEVLKLKPGEDIIHFRQGIDPANIRKGLSPLRGLLRTIWTDQEAALFAAALLKNGGVPGLMISPATPEASIDREQAQAMKAQIESRTRTGRGKTTVWSAPVKVEQFGFSPQQLDLSPLRDVAEERVTAALGIAASVVGFGAGLQTAKVGATMRELRQLSYHNGVVPLWRTIGSTLSTVLAKDLGKASRIGFDLSDIDALREDADSLANRIERLVRAGLLTRAEARAELGYQPNKGDEVYLLSLTTVEVPVGQTRDATALAGGKALEAKHRTPSLLEERLIATTPRRDVPQVADRFSARIDRIRTAAIEPFAERLLGVFSDLGKRVYRAALDVLGKAGDPGETKEDVNEQLQAERLRARMEQEIADIERALEEAFGLSYLSVADGVIKQMGEVFGIEIRVTDPMQVAILREGGTRAGLLDLTQQAKDSLFEALAAGREQGLAGDNLARFIRDQVEAGPWRDAATRARVIARTEGAHAANTATIEAAHAMGFQEFMVLDNRTGFDDEVCSEINGHIVSANEAATLGLAHPNCTRSYTPITPQLRQEMGL